MLHPAENFHFIGIRSTTSARQFWFLFGSTRRRTMVQSIEQPRSSIRVTSTRVHGIWSLSYGSWSILVDQNAKPSMEERGTRCALLVMEHFPLDDAGESELARGSRSGQGPHEAKPEDSCSPLLFPLFKLLFLPMMFGRWSLALPVGESSI